MGSEWGFCVRTLGALGVLKEEVWVINVTNGRSDYCRDSVSLKAANCVGNFQRVALTWFTLKTFTAYVTNTNKCAVSQLDT